MRHCTASPGRPWGESSVVSWGLNRDRMEIIPPLFMTCHRTKYQNKFMGDLNFGFVLISFVGIQSQSRCQQHSQKYKCKCTKILREKSSLSKKCRWTSTAEKREEAPIISLTFHQKLLFLSLSYEFRWAFSLSISSFLKLIERHLPPFDTKKKHIWMMVDLNNWNTSSNVKDPNTELIDFGRTW